ncbi:DgyrCDS1765 [Dimorphilus gyrociliatus]|uniref:DgyrCDS1765 n=1 Tax=Dimorphilus gyrociliatus TaxID=2664684 RepID=A0A7I8V8J2_9ANNE|nr:DgyrCDS1765 [Dimorphilus gyrociliatus]
MCSCMNQPLPCRTSQDRPTVPFDQPLSVDTSVEYEIDYSKFPDWDKSEQALRIALPLHHLPPPPPPPPPAQPTQPQQPNNLSPLLFVPTRPTNHLTNVHRSEIEYLMTLIDSLQRPPIAYETQVIRRPPTWKCVRAQTNRRTKRKLCDYVTESCKLSRLYSQTVNQDILFAH